MKKTLMSFALLPLLALADTWTDPDTGIEWTYFISGDSASVGGSDCSPGSDSSPAVPSSTAGAITIPSTLGVCSVTSIGDWAFGNCSGLTSVTIPSDVTSIGRSAFFGCSGLTSVAIPSSVTSIGEGAFSQCSKLTSVTIPSSLTSIGDYAFYNCIGLASVTMPSSVTSIGNYAFGWCYGLTSVTISSSVTSIGGYAFCGCSGLSSMMIPSGVTNIGAGAFSSCSGLTSVTMPSSVTSVGDYAFHGCSGLKEFSVDPANPNYKAVDGFLLTKDGKTLVAGANGIVTIPSGVTSVGEGAFYGYSELKSVTMPSGMTSIGDWAFEGCSGLTSVTIPSSVTSIGNYAFEGCSGLSGVDFEGAPPDGLSAAEIKADAVIRYNVAYEDEWLPVIADCGFTNARPYVPPMPDGGPYVEIVDGVEWTFVITNSKANVSAIKTSAAGDVSIPSMLGGQLVIAINDNAFNSCSNMTSVTIPVSVKAIGDSAFEGCRSLKDVYFEGDSVSSVGANAFKGCCWDLIMHVPETWQGRGRTICGYSVWKGDEPNEVVRVVSTNVVVHYLTTNVPVAVVAPILSDTGIVNVMTEVKGGNVAIPDSWAKNFPTFEEKFGGDFTTALTKPTGKRDCDGGAMQVWQDYVAGTDPTDTNDVFTASITMVGGVLKISYSPEFKDANEAAMRKYTTYGKVKLTDEKWIKVPEGGEADYNFFKVTVEMK